MALSEGVSLVLELPACFATGSAEFFARGAVRMLRQTGVTDSICFGCEQASLPLFHEISAVLADEPEIYRRVLKSALSQGQSYPSARQQALSACLPALDIDSFLQSPNNILGLEYIRALNQEPGTVVPFPIQRIGSGYHDKTVTGTYSSATAIRREIHGKQISSSALEQLPPQAAAILKQQLANRGSLEIDRFSPLLKYALLSESAASLCRYQDMTEALANRIMNRLNDFISISSFISLLKTRELTYSRISRALLHVMLKLYRRGPLTCTFAEKQLPAHSRFPKGCRCTLERIKAKLHCPCHHQTSRCLQDSQFIRPDGVRTGHPCRPRLRNHHDRHLSHPLPPRIHPHPRSSSDQRAGVSHARKGSALGLQSLRMNANS